MIPGPRPGSLLRLTGSRIFHVSCPLGLEQVVVDELEALRLPESIAPPTDVQPVSIGGVEFNGELETGYAANLWLRTAIRVQEQLAFGHDIVNEDALYRLAKSIDWSRYLTPEMTFAFDAHSRDSFARDARFAALVCKDAAVDQLRDLHGVRPSVDRHKPELPLKVVALGDEVAIYRSFTHRSLHKRGYRPIQTKSPLSEVLAAGLLQLAGWKAGDDRPLLDPMCGSGTFPIEAAWIAADRAPGLTSRFAFERWPDFNADAWNELLDAARVRAHTGKESVPRIEAADRHAGALEIAQDSAEKAGVQGMVRFRRSEVSGLDPRNGPRIVVVNPPYGKRIGGPDLDNSWRSLGTFLHGLDPGVDAYVLCGLPELTRHLRMRAASKHRVLNGSLDCRWLHYPIGGNEGEPEGDG